MGVIYYDRAILRKADKAGMCKPCCTHMSLCPTCCDMYVRVGAALGSRGPGAALWFRGSGGRQAATPNVSTTHCPSRAAAIAPRASMSASGSPCGCCVYVRAWPVLLSSCGEGLVLHGAWAWSTELTAVPGLCCTCCKCWTMLPGLDDAEVLSAAINNARDKAMERAKSGVAAEAIP